MTVALTTLMVNARHLFYGISMLDAYRGMGRGKPYLIFSLTDETYSLVSRPLTEYRKEERKAYYFGVSLLDHLYWITGSVLGAVAGAVLPINTEGVDFALTALFLVVFLEGWKGTKDHLPAVTGVLASVLCLLVFGADRFLIPAMGLIAVVLCLAPERGAEA